MVAVGTEFERLLEQADALVKELGLSAVDALVLVAAYEDEGEDA